MISWFNFSRTAFTVHNAFKNCFLVSIDCIWLTDIVLKLFLNLCCLLNISSWIVFYKNYSFSKQFAKSFQVFNSPPSWTWPKHILQSGSSHLTYQSMVGQSNPSFLGLIKRWIGLVDLFTKWIKVGWVRQVRWFVLIALN